MVRDPQQEPNSAIRHPPIGKNRQQLLVRQLANISLRRCRVDHRRVNPNLIADQRQRRVAHDLNLAQIVPVQRTLHDLIGDIESEIRCSAELLALAHLGPRLRRNRQVSLLLHLLDQLLRLPNYRVPRPMPRRRAAREPIDYTCSLEPAHALDPAATLHHCRDVLGSQRNAFWPASKTSMYPAARFSLHCRPFTATASTSS